MIKRINHKVKFMPCLYPLIVLPHYCISYGDSLIFLRQFDKRIFQPSRHDYMYTANRDSRKFLRLAIWNKELIIIKITNLETQVSS